MFKRINPYVKILILFTVVLVVIWGWAYIEICKLFFENKIGGI